MADCLRTHADGVCVLSAPIEIAHSDDPRVAAFRHNDSESRTPSSGGRVVVAEGRLVTQRAIAAGLRVEAIVCTAAHLRALSVPRQTACYVTSHAVLAELARFEFHRGVLARVCVPTRPQLEQAALDRLRAKPCPKLLGAFGIADPGNIGAIVRAAYAFGIDHVFVSQRGADPYGRKAIRASAGYAFELAPIVCADPVAEVERLRRILGLELVALSPTGNSYAQSRAAQPVHAAAGPRGSRA